MKGIRNIVAFILVWTALAAVTLGIALIALALHVLLLLTGAAARAAQASRLLAGTLMPGETVVAEGLQRRAFAFTRRRRLLAITTSRLIVLRRGLFGGFRMHDIQWKDLTDARLEQNVWPSRCGSNLAFDHANTAVPPLAVDGIASDVAATIYAHAQYEEQAWEEKRRVRGMEETRAAAGGVVVHSSPGTAAAPPAAAHEAGNRMLEQIAKAKALLDAGAVSDAEFQEMKAKILGAG